MRLKHEIASDSVRGVDDEVVQRQIDRSCGVDVVAYKAWISEARAEVLTFHSDGIWAGRGRSVIRAARRCCGECLVLEYDRNVLKVLSVNGTESEIPITKRNIEFPLPDRSRSFAQNGPQALIGGWGKCLERRVVYKT